MPLEPHWSSAFAAGAPDWLGIIGGDNMDLTEYIRPAVAGTGSEDSTHILRLPQTVLLRLWHALSKKQKR